MFNLLPKASFKGRGGWLLL